MEIIKGGSVMHDQVGKLAVAFAGWGPARIKKVQELTRKHGVLCSSWYWSDGERG